MSLTDEQAKAIKEQLLKQIENFPEDRREFAKNYILKLNGEQLEEFLAKNNLLKQGQQPEAGEENKEEYQKKGKERTDCVYCLISNQQIEALPIYEDKNYLACLEIKPFSEGHIILIPKKHIKKAKSLPNKALSIANKIGKHLVKRLKAENFHISSSDEMKHAIINIIPIYKGEKLSFERKVVDPKKLQEIAIQIGRLEEAKKRAAKKKASEKQVRIKETEAKTALLKLPRRIP